MATIYMDKQSGVWKLKTTLDGRDKRIPLRKATDAERQSWERGDRNRPTDVLRLAARHADFSIVKTAPLSDDPPDDLAGFLDWFQRDYGKHSRPGSVTRMDGVLRHFREFMLGKPPGSIADVGETFLDSYFAWRLEQVDPRLKIKIKPYTAVSEMELLSGVFSTAVDRDKLPVNPLTKVLRRLRKAYPRPDPSQETKYLDPSQLRAFLTALERGVADGIIPELYADLARAMLASGLRVAAACAMEWSWIGKDGQLKVPPLHDKAKCGYTAIVADLGREALSRRRLATGGSGRVFPGANPNMSYYWLGKVCRKYQLDDWPGLLPISWSSDKANH